MGINCEDRLCGSLSFAVILAHFLIRIETRKPVFTLDKWRKSKGESKMICFWLELNVLVSPAKLLIESKWWSLCSVLFLCDDVPLPSSGASVYIPRSDFLWRLNGLSIYLIHFNIKVYDSMKIQLHFASVFLKRKTFLLMLYVSACTVCMIYCTFFCQ